MESKIEFKEFEDKKDLVKIQNLFKACYGNVPLSEGGKYPSLEELEWRYLKCPFKSKIFVAEDTDKGVMVGIRPVVLKKIKINNVKGIGVQFMDVMVHPAYRRRGIFTQLIRITQDYLKKNKVLLAYTFPNKNSYPAYKKFKDWRELGFFKVFMNVKNIFPFQNFNIDRNIDIEVVKSFDKRVDMVLDEFLNLYNICVYRNTEYLNWRFSERPDIKYKVILASIRGQLKGYAVLRIRKTFMTRVGLVLEIVCSPEYDIFGNLLKYSLKEFKKSGVKWVLFFNFYNKIFETVLKRNHFFHFFLFERARKIPLLIKPFATNFSTEIMNPENWYISLGDNDAV